MRPCRLLTDPAFLITTRLVSPIRGTQVIERNRLRVGNTGVSVHIEAFDSQGHVAIRSPTDGTLRDGRDDTIIAMRDN
jgi:hypothetical protein